MVEDKIQPIRVKLALDEIGNNDISLPSTKLKDIRSQWPASQSLA